MKKTMSWVRMLSRLTRYLAYRAGLARKPTFMDIREEAKTIVCQVRGWRRRLRVLEPGRCPDSGSAIFAGNHCFTEDPFIMYYAISEASGRRVNPRFMMREGIFSKSRLFNSRLFDIDEFGTLFGAILISRDKVQLSQLKPFVKLLRDGKSFIIYPTRTRSRTGAIVEFPEGLEEPGGVSFFVAQAQRGRPELRVATVPVTRTDNLVTGSVTLVFGEPQYLEAGAGREEQREFDFRLMRAIADAVVINVPQVLSALLYLRCLHGAPADVETSELADSVEKALKHIETAHYIDADARDVPGQVEDALRWLAEAGLLRREGTRAVLNRDAVLACPPHDREYRRKNPVKYLVNQILHLPDVLAAVEDCLLTREMEATGRK